MGRRWGVDRVTAVLPQESDTDAQQRRLAQQQYLLAAPGTAPHLFPAPPSAEDSHFYLHLHFFFLLELYFYR